MTRIIVLFALVLLAALSPAPALAFSPVSGLPAEQEILQADSGAKPACDAQRRLAGIVETEAMEQPAAAQIIIAQIVVAEARSRGISVCALSETNFLATWRWARAHPGSWHAQRFASPEDWALSLAGDVLAGALPDLTDGAMHFDGDWQNPTCARVIAQTCLRP